MPGVVHVDVREGHLDNWRAVTMMKTDFELIIMDTPPALEDHPTAFRALAQMSNLVLVPSGATSDDVASNIPWLISLKASNAKAVAVLYRVNRQTKSFRTARQRLLRVANVAPIEVPAAEDMHIHLEVGLTSLDVQGSKGIDSIESLWDYIRHETGILAEREAEVA